MGGERDDRDQMRKETKKRIYIKKIFLSHRTYYIRHKINLKGFFFF